MLTQNKRTCFFFCKQVFLLSRNHASNHGRFQKTKCKRTELQGSTCDPKNKGHAATVGAFTPVPERRARIVLLFCLLLGLTPVKGSTAQFSRYQAHNLLQHEQEPATRGKCSQGNTSGSQEHWNTQPLDDPWVQKRRCATTNTRSKLTKFRSQSVDT